MATILSTEEFRKLGTPFQKTGGVFEVAGGEFKLLEGGRFELTGGSLPQNRLPDQPTVDDTIAGLSLSLPSFDKADETAIREAEEKRTEIRRGQVREQFGEEITEAREEGVAEQRALGGQLGVERRFSSSARAFLKFIDTENQKEITRLEKRRDAALVNLDLTEVQNINQQIESERERRQENFNNIVKLIQLAQTQAAGKRTEVQEERLVRSEELDKFNDLLKAGALADIDREDVVSLSISTGLSEGIIESAIKANKDKRNTRLDTRKFPDGSIRTTIIDEDTGEVISQETLAEAPPEVNILNQFRQFLKDNPTVSIEKARSVGLEKGIPVEQVNAELAVANVIKEKVQITDDQASEVAVALVKSFTQFGTITEADRSEVDRAIEAIQQGKIEIEDANGKKKIVDLSARQIQVIVDAINEEFPLGARTRLQRFLPGGK